MSTSSTPTVFVCGATGSQGGCLARQLRKLGWHVNTTVRNVESPEAEALRRLGVRITKGDWDNEEALVASISRCQKLFLCLFPNFSDPSCESRQAQNILSIAKRSGVNHVVASTTLGVSMLDAKVHVPPGSFMEKHFTSKKSIERVVSDSGVEHYTILRPGFFMANFLEPKVNRYSEVRDKGTWTTTMTDRTKLALIDHDDIAKFAVAAFLNSERFTGKAIALASELLTVQQTLSELGSAAGQGERFKAIFMTDEEIEKQEASNGLMNSQKSMRFMSDYVDMKELAKIVPLTPFKEFLDREKDGVAQTYH